jgi:hypothetical protein
MDGDAAAVVVRLMRGGDVAGSEEEEYCISALYGMSRGSMRFCGLALVAGVKAVLQDLAQRMLHAMPGEDDEAPVTAVGMLGRQWDQATLFDLILKLIYAWGILDL